MTSPTIVGLDIGYSATKVVFGGHRSQMLTLPNVAARPEAFTRSLQSGAVSTDGVEVLLNGERWIAGADPATVKAGWQPVIDESYPKTPEYLAMAYAALSKVGSPVVDVLTVGLPVSQYKDHGQREALRHRLEGLHVINDDRSVNVRQVLVVPQPAGAYTDLVAELSGSQKISGLDSVLVVDPGHFSFDWCLVQGGFNEDASGNTVLAGEAILQETRRLVDEASGRKVSLVKLSEAIRTGEDRVVVGGESVAIRPHLEEAARTIADTAFREIRRTVRDVQTTRPVEYVFLAGGCAELVEAAVEREFRDAKVYRSTRPVMANARGFWLLAQAQAASRKAA